MINVHHSWYIQDSYFSLVLSGADPGFDQGGAPDRDRPKTAILGPQFCRILVLGPHFWWSGGGARAPRPPPGSTPDYILRTLKKQVNK